MGSVINLGTIVHSAASYCFLWHLPWETSSKVYIMWQTESSTGMDFIHSHSIHERHGHTGVSHKETPLKPRPARCLLRGVVTVHESSFTFELPLLCIRPTHKPAMVHPGLARPQFFPKFGWSIIFHLFQLRMAVLIPKQDRPMAAHGWRILYHFMHWRCVKSIQKCLVIPLLCSFSLLVLCIFFRKITRFISVSHSDRLTVPPSGALFTSTPSASPIGISAGAFLSEKW